MRMNLWKIYLWAPPLWVGRLLQPSLGYYISNIDEKNLVLTRVNKQIIKKKSSKFQENECGQTKSMFLSETYP